MNKVSQKQRNDLGENKVSYGIFPWIIVHNYSGFFVFTVRFVEALSLFFEPKTLAKLLLLHVSFRDW